MWYLGKKKVKWKNKQMTETYSYLEGKFKYYISIKFFDILQHTYPQQNILDKYVFLKSGFLKVIQTDF